jgi:rhodanese-related sulfurtransferase
MVGRANFAESSLKIPPQYRPLRFCKASNHGTGTYLPQLLTIPDLYDDQSIDDLLGDIILEPRVIFVFAVKHFFQVVEPMNSSAAELPWEVDVSQTKQLLESGEPMLLLDCREPSEYATAKISGAVLIPMREISHRLSELEPFRETPLVVHCHHGGRSMQVTQWLRRNGFPQAQNMQGGIDQWSLQIDTSVPRY